jgi:hypothetical protein
MSAASSIFVRQFLTGGAVLGVAWWFHSHWLVPLQHREVESLKALADVRQRISEAKAKIREIGEQEQAAGGARGLLESLRDDVPKEPTAVWLPVRLQKHLRTGGISEAGIRLNSTIPEPGVTGYERTYWHVNLPMQDGTRTMNGLLLAVGEIERQEPFVRILDISFVSGSEEPHWPVGGLNVTALVPK